MTPASPEFTHFHRNSHCISPRCPRLPASPLLLLPFPTVKPQARKPHTTQKSPTPHRKAPAGSARCVLPTAPKSQPQGWCEMKGTACCLSCYSPEWEANTLFAMWNVFTCPKTSRSSTLHLFCATVISILDEGTGITLIWELRIAM